MKHCPKCTSKYSDDLSFCLIDGEPLFQNDPQAETLKGQVLTSSKLKTISIVGKVIDRSVTLTLNKPFSLLESSLTIILLLKEIRGKDDESVAMIGVYGNVLLQVGEKVRHIGGQEFLFPECGDSDEQIWSVYHLNFANGHTTFFRVYVIHIDNSKNKVTVNIAFCVTEPVR